MNSERINRLNKIQKIVASIWVIFFVTGIPIYIYVEYYDNINNVGVILYLIWGSILAITMALFAILEYKIKKLNEMENKDEEKKA